MSKFLTKKTPEGETLNFKFGVRAWRWFCGKHNAALSEAFQKIVVVSDKNPDGDINLDKAVDLIVFAAKDAAISKGNDPDAITEEIIEDWIEELGFMDFIAEAVEFAAEQMTDQQKQEKSGKAPAKKK